jgi:CBS domain-containing protein
MMKLRDLMSRDVVCFSPETGLTEAIETLAEHHISGAPVLRGEKVVGVLSSSDILEFVACNPTALADFGDRDADSRDGNALAGRTVSEAMSGGPACTLPMDAPVMAAAEVMRTAGIHRVFVTDGERLVGVVTSLDVTRALAERKVTSRTFVYPARTRTD